MSARSVIVFVVITALAGAADVGAQEAPATPAGALRQVAYPVADLIVPVHMDATTPSPKARTTIEETLIRLVRSTCEPQSWDAVGGPGRIQYLPKEMTLVVTQTGRCHEQVRGLFAELRKLQDVEISVTSRYLTLTADQVKVLETSAQRGGIGKLIPADGPDAVCLSDRELFLLLAWAQADRGVSVMQAPKITAFNGQKCFVVVADRVGVKDGDVDQDGKPIAAPTVEVGLHSILQSVLEPDDGSVRLALECSVTAQDRTTPRGRVFATRRVQHIVRVPPSQTVVLKLGPAAHGTQQYVLLTPGVHRQSEQDAVERAADEPASQPERARRERCVRVFPVADLLAPIVAEPEVSGVSAIGSPAKAPAPADLLVEMIMATIVRSSGKDMGGASAIQYYPVGQGLVVSHHGEVQEEVEALLGALRRLHSARISLDCRLVELSEATAQRIALGPFIKETTSAPPLASAAEEQDRSELFLIVPPNAPEAGLSLKPLLPHGKTSLRLNQRDALDLRRLLAEESPAAEQLLGAVTFNGCRVRIDKTRPYTYTTDVKVGLEDGRIVVKPITSSVRLGTVIEALPVASADGTGLSLEISVEHSTLMPGRAQTVRAGPAGAEADFVLETPSRRVINAKAMVDVAKAETLVLPVGTVLGDVRHEHGPPVLAKVSYLSRLFRTVGYGREARQLYVMITPQIHAR